MSSNSQDSRNPARPCPSKTNVVRLSMNTCGCAGAGRGAASSTADNTARASSAWRRSVCGARKPDLGAGKDATESMAGGEPRDEPGARAARRGPGHGDGDRRSMRRARVPPRRPRTLRGLPTIPGAEAKEKRPAPAGCPAHAGSAAAPGRRAAPKNKPPPRGEGRSLPGEKSGACRVRPGRPGGFPGPPRAPRASGAGPSGAGSATSYPLLHVHGLDPDHGVLGQFLAVILGLRADAQGAKPHHPALGMPKVM